ncbi:peptidoglycan recognition protein [Streptomyces sp. SL13]|uniref:Peptidoglycan recognition protein n=1 Tax=Streptantibioticus silvisoli TaxID=2705255 RepID=A0AA90H6W0_9ACTN|nr:peptidoglycan recognition protein [Streptantibioticus silvisoli]MDI5966241.1 peptidoglycan recognition protein [Streptantibioticus silvisoli]MDI5971582.1 peptidoglycan recognition protein [Streptantibioticus silvisoli]
MTIDRRTMLRGMGRTAAAGAIGVALAATVAVRQPQPRAVRHLGARRVVDHWAAPHPDIVPRTAWHTDAVRTHGRPHPCAPDIKAVFVHHTDSGNDYSREDVPRMIQSFYDDHIEGNAWDDIGYNFLVDRMGTIYEGRAGGIDNAVIGAHTLGFNVGTVGIAAIGSFGPAMPAPDAMLESIARIAAWKLGMYGVDARARTVLVSSNDGARYRRGARAVFHTVSGHRDGYQTTCPGEALYAQLPDVRLRARRLQGRAAPGVPGWTMRAAV